MLAAAAVTFVGIVSLAFLVIALQQQAEDRRIERLTMDHVQKLAQRYRDRWRVPASAPTEGYVFEERRIDAGPTQFPVEPRLGRREEPKAVTRNSPNETRKRAA